MTPPPAWLDADAAAQPIEGTMSKEPIDLTAERMKRGEPMFFCCPCGTEDGWFVVAVHTSNGPVISSLVCMECEAQSDVSYGRMTEPTKPE